MWFLYYSYGKFVFGHGLFVFFQASVFPKIQHHKSKSIFSGLILTSPAKNCFEFTSRLSHVLHLWLTETSRMIPTHFSAYLLVAFVNEKGKKTLKLIIPQFFVSSGLHAMLYKHPDTIIYTASQFSSALKAIFKRKKKGT